MNVKIDFYADTFRSGTIEIPDSFKRLPEYRRRYYTSKIIQKDLRDQGVEIGLTDIKIITAKIL